jgi:hypothetical protein
LVRRLQLRTDAQQYATWNGADEQGRVLPSGVYLIRVAGELAAPVKVILQR